MNAFKLYFRYIDLSFRGQMQYRMSFVMMTVGNFLGSGIEFVGILALFDRFGSLRTWSLPEVAFFYGLVNPGVLFNRCRITRVRRYGASG